MKLLYRNFTLEKPQKITIMNSFRSFITALILILIGASISFAQTPSVNDDSRQTIVMNTTFFDKNSDVDRIGEQIININYIPITNEIEVSLYNVGIAHIYLVDINGNIIEESITDTNTPSTTFISTINCHTNFYIVIYTDYIYSEGYVTI